MANGKDITKGIADEIRKDVAEQQDPVRIRKDSDGISLSDIKASMKNKPKEKGISLGNIKSNIKSGEKSWADTAPQVVGGDLNYEPLNKYDRGLLRGMHQGDVRAANQNNWKAGLNSAVQSVTNLVGDTVSGFGYLLELPTVLSGIENTEGEVGNVLTDIGDWIKEQGQEIAPIYASQQAMGFAPGNAEWWAINAPSIASSISLMIPAGAAAKGLSLFGRATKISQLIAKSGSKLGIGSLTKLSSQRGITAAITSRHIENLMNSNETYRQVYDEQIAKGIDKEEANRLAAQAAADTYKYGYTLILGDVIQYSSIFGALSKTIDKSKLAKYTLGTLGQGAVEAGEEGFQYIIDKESQRKVALEQGLKDSRTFSQRISEYVKDPEFKTSAAFGAIGGMLFDVIGKSVSKAANLSEDEQERQFYQSIINSPQELEKAEEFVDAALEETDIPDDQRQKLQKKKEDIAFIKQQQKELPDNPEEVQRNFDLRQSETLLDQTQNSINEYRSKLKYSNEQFDKIVYTFQQEWLKDNPDSEAESIPNPDEQKKFTSKEGVEVTPEIPVPKNFPYSYQLKQVVRANMQAQDAVLKLLNPPTQEEVKEAVQEAETAQNDQFEFDLTQANTPQDYNQLINKYPDQSDRINQVKKQKEQQEIANYPRQYNNEEDARNKLTDFFTNSPFYTERILSENDNLNSINEIVDDIIKDKFKKEVEKSPDEVLQEFKDTESSSDRRDLLQKATKRFGNNSSIVQEMREIYNREKDVVVKKPVETEVNKASKEDELYPSVLDKVRNNPNYKILDIQRSYRIGYNRAKKLFEQAKDEIAKDDALQQETQEEADVLYTEGNDYMVRGEPMTYDGETDKFYKFIDQNGKSRRVSKTNTDAIQTINNDEIFDPEQERQKTQEQESFTEGDQQETEQETSEEKTQETGETDLETLKEFDFSEEAFETSLSEQLEQDALIEEQKYDEPEYQEIVETPDDFIQDVVDQSDVVEGEDSSYAQTLDMMLYKWTADNEITLSPSRQPMSVQQAKQAGYQLKGSYQENNPYYTVLKDGEPVSVHNDEVDIDFARNHVHKYANQDIFFEVPNNPYVKKGADDITIYHAIETPDGVKYISKLKAYYNNPKDPYNAELKKIRETVYNEWIENNKQPFRSKKLKTKIEAGMSGRFWNTKERQDLPSGVKLAVGVSRSGQKVELSTFDAPTDGIIYEPSNPKAGAVYAIVPTSGIIGGKRTYTYARLFTKKLYQVPRLKQQLIDILNKVNDKEDWEKNWRQYLRQAQEIIRFKKGENIYPNFNERLANPQQYPEVQRFYNPDGTFNADTFIKAYSLDEKIVQIDHNKINRTEEGVPYNETIKDRIGFDINYNQPTHSPKFKYEPSVPINEDINVEEDVLKNFGEDMDFSFKPKGFGRRWNPEESLKWLKKNRPDMPVEIQNIVGYDGIWTKAATYIDRNASEGTLYHEAFHDVFTLSTTNEQKTKLLNDVKKRHPKVDSVKLGNLKANYPKDKFTDSELIDLYYEEILADEFSEYTLSFEAPSNLIKKFFRKLWLLIKKTVNTLETKEYFELVNSQGFTRRSVKLSDKFDRKYSLPNGINSYTELKERVDSSLYMIEAIYASLRKNDTTTEPLKIYNKIIREGYIERMFPLMIEKQKRNNPDIDPSAYDRFRNSLPQLKSYVLRALSKKGIVVDQNLISEISYPDDFEKDYEITGDSVIQDDWTGKSTLQQSQKEKPSPRLKRWLTTIPVIIDGKVQRDSLGFPKFYSGNVTYSVLQRTIGDSVSPEHMMERFLNASNSEFIKNIYDRITGDEKLGESMKTELWNTIGQKVNPLFVTSVEDKMVVSNTQRIENQIQKDIRGAFNPTDSTKSDYEILNKVNAKGELYWKDSNKPDLTLLKRFKEKYSLAIPDDVLRQLQKNGQMKKFMDELGFLVESKSTNLKKLTDLIKPYYAEGYQSSFLSVEGEPIYGWINASFMGRQINSIKSGKFINEFYASDPFISNLTLFKDINNFKDNIDFVIIEGHKEDTNKREGTSFVNMSEKDLLQTLLNIFDSSKKKAIIALPVLSDAGALTGVRVNKLTPEKAANYITNVVNAERMRMNDENQTNHRFKNKHIMFPFIESTDSAKQVKDKFTNYVKEEVTALKEKADEYGIKTDENKLIEFALNHMAYQAQLIPLLMGDPAYYKNSADFFKRSKEIWSPGTYLNTNNFFVTEDNRLIEFPKSGTYNVIVQRDIEEISDEETLKGIEANAGKEIADQYRDEKNKISVTDAQSYIDLYTLRLQYIGQNRWTHEMQRLFDDIIHYRKPTADLSIIFQPNKPFYFGHLKLNNSVYPMQNKDSEMVLTPDYVIQKGDQKLKKIMESMGYKFNPDNTWTFDETGRNEGKYVDKFTFTTAIKTPVHSTIQSVDDIDMQKAVQFNWSDWRRQMETPEHHVDSDNIFGTQIMKLITADLSNEPIYNLKGEKLTGNEVYEKYNKLVIDDIRASLNSVKKRLSDKTNILNAIRQEIVNRNLGQIYLDLLQDIEGETVMPLYHPAILYKVETIVNSIIRSNVTRQKFKRGVALFNASPFGLKRKPKIKFNADNTIKHIEVYAPVYNKEFMKYYNSETGEFDMENIPEHLLEGIVYRIPTEDKYSMFKIKVIGLLPPHMGGNIIMPKEVTKIAGLDYDIDKVFGFFYEDAKSELSYALSPELYGKYQKEINDLRDSIKEVKEFYDNPVYKLAIEERQLKYEIATETDPEMKKILQSRLRVVSEQVTDQQRADLNDAKEAMNEFRDEIKKLYQARNQEALDSLEPGEYQEYKRKIDSDNQKLDIMREVLTHSGKSFFNPGGFETIKKNTNQSDPGEYNVNGKKWLPITAPTTELKIAERINTGRQLIGIAANYNAVHAIFQQHNLRLPRGFRFKNRIYDNLSVVNEIQPDGSESNVLVTRNISENLAAFVDNGKDPRAEYYNMNEYTADVAFGLLSTGVPLEDVMNLLKQPILKELSKQVKIKGEFGAVNYYGEYDVYVTQGLPPEVSQIFAKARLSYDESGDWKSDLTQEEINMLSDELIEKLNNANILSDWWQYKTEAKQIADLVNAVKVADAGPGTTFIKNYFKLESVNQDFNIEGYESIFEDTYTAEFIKAIPYAQDLFINQLGFPNIQTGQLKKILTTIEGVTTKTLTEKGVEDVFRNYMDYVMSGVYPYDEQLIPDVTKRLSEYKVNNDNTFTNALTVDNELIQLNGIVGLDVFEQEEIRNGWRDLFRDNKQLAIDLAIYSYMLHGFRRTGFTLFQPLEIYEELGVKQFLESTISDLNGSYTIDWDFIDQYMANEGHRSPVLIERAKEPTGEARPVYYRNSKTRSVFRLSRQTGYYELLPKRGKLINKSKENPYGSGKTNNYNFRNQNTTISNLKHTEVKDDSIKVKLDTTDKELKAGSVVKYKDKTWMVWRINPNDRVQLINVNGDKYSGTPMTSTVTDITGSLPVVEYNGTPYIVSTNLNIYSTATGKQVYTGSDSTSESARKSILNKLKDNC